VQTALRMETTGIEEENDVGDGGSPDPGARVLLKK
jgi:hypothetical protein